MPSRPLPVMSRFRGRPTKTGLKAEENEQESLANEMLLVVGKIKETTMNMQAIISRDNQLLTESSGSMEVKKKKLGEENRRLNIFNKKSTGNFITGWFIVLAAILLFMFVMFFIKLFRK